MNTQATQDRWRVALHEAGHVLAGKLAFGATPEAAIWGDNGIAFRLGNGPLDLSGRHRETEHTAFRIAVVAIAGEQAKDLFDAPEDLPPVAPSAPRSPANDATPEEQEIFSTILRRPSDREQVMSCCGLLARRAVRKLTIPRRVCAGDVSHQFFRVQRLAQRLLRRHESEIEAIARVLYASGIYRAPAQTGTEKEKLNMSAKIIEALERKRAKARTAYIRALTEAQGHLTDALAEKIGTLAVEAGVTPEQIESDCALLDKAGALAEQANTLPSLERKYKGAIAKANELSAELERVRQPLEAALTIAADEAAMLEKQIATTREAARSLAGLCNEYPDLLPLERQPAPVRETADRQKRDTVLEALKREEGKLIGRQREASFALADAQADNVPWVGRPGDRPDGWGVKEKARVAEAETALAAVQAELDGIQARIEKLVK